MQKFKVRRRLVRLLKSKSIDLESDAGFVADYLISHGVTVLPKGTIVLTRAEIEALNKYQKRLNEGVITNNENKSNNSADKSNEKIEEMAKVIKSSLDGLGSGNFNFTGDEISTMFAEALYNAGYREAFEVAVFEKKLEETEEKLMACCMEQMNYDEMSIYIIDHYAKTKIKELFAEIEFEIHQLDFDREETRAIAIEGIIASVKKKYTEGGE